MTMYAKGSILKFYAPGSSPPETITIANIEQLQLVTGSPPGPVHPSEGSGEIKNGTSISVRTNLLTTDDAYDTLKTTFENDYNLTFHATSPDGTVTADFIASVLDWVEVAPPGATAATPRQITFVLKVTDDNP